MKKKILSLMLCGAVSATVVACSSGSNSTNNSDGGGAVVGEFGTTGAYLVSSSLTSDMAADADTSSVTLSVKDASKLDATYSIGASTKKDGVGVYNFATFDNNNSCSFDSESKVTDKCTLTFNRSETTPSGDYIITLVDITKTPSLEFPNKITTKVAAKVTTTKYRIKVSDNAHQGDFAATTEGTSDIAAKDAEICGEDYKILAIAGNRTPTNSTDWPLKADTTYYRKDSTTIIGTTNSNAVFIDSLNDTISTTNDIVWTGIKVEDSSWVANNDNCSDFSSNDRAYSGEKGDLGYTNYKAFNVSLTDICTLPHKLICVSTKEV